MARQIRQQTDKFIGLAVIFLLIGLVGVATVLGMGLMTEAGSYEYGIVMDAGSSHTSLYIYRWDSKRVGRTGLVEEVEECEAPGKGLEKFKDNPSAAGTSLMSCLDKAKDEIPSSMHSYSRVYLGATAGMRLLKIQNPDADRKVFDSVRETVENYPFYINDAAEQIRIISGRDEGIGLWVTANYASGTLVDIFDEHWYDLLPEGPDSTLGVLDLGGASTQIAFRVNYIDGLPRNVSQRVTLFGNKLKLYSDSFLCYGADQMRLQLLGILAENHNYTGIVPHPCYAKGYSSVETYAHVFGESPCTKAYANSVPLKTIMNFVGTGDNKGCVALAKNLFDRSRCTWPKCSFLDHPLPPVPQRFLARGSFYYTMKDLGVLDDTHLVNYQAFTQARDKWCQKNLTEINTYGLHDPTSVCANAHYIDQLLTNIYNISTEHWHNIIFAKKVNDLSMGWTLGYMTNLTSSIPNVPRLTSYSISTPAFVVILATAGVCIILGVVFSCLAFSFRRQKYSSLLG